jgi:hypothetical protein
MFMGDGEIRGYIMIMVPHTASLMAAGSARVGAQGGEKRKHLYIKLIILDILSYIRI